MGRAIIEKEAYVIMASCDRMGLMLLEPSGLDIFAGHTNLISIFDPLSLLPDLAVSSMEKVLRLDRASILV